MLEVRREKNNMKNAEIVMVVGTQCPPEKEAEFNKWYNEAHIPRVFAYKGIKEVTRYRTMTESKESPKYLSIIKIVNQKAYDEFLKSPEFAAAGADAQKAVEDLGMVITWNATYEAIKAWKR